MTPVQKFIYQKLMVRKGQTAYQLNARLTTLRALERLGKARQLPDKNTAGAMFSPSTHYRFVKIEEE